jgi:integrase
MPTAKLTDKTIANLKVPNPEKGGPRQVRYFDKGVGQTGLALILLVSYGGAKSWFVGTYVDGIARRPDKATKEPTTVKVRKLRTHKLGTYPEMKLKEARDEARRYFNAPERFRQQAQVGSFAEIAEKWFKERVVARRLRSRSEIRRQLDKYILPVWAAKPFLDIRRREVNNLLSVIAEQNGRAQADACLATIRLIMGWWQVQDDDYTSPIVKGMKRAAPQARDRSFNDNEIRRLWAACDQHGRFGAMLKVALLTGQRRDKLATMRWDDIVGDIASMRQDDAIGDTWIIRTEEREKKNAKKLKLPPVALDIIKAQPPIHGNPYVFPGVAGGPFNNFAQAKVRLDQTLQAQPEGPMAPWVLHDLRRTSRTLMERAGVQPRISEKVLGHALQGVEKVYNQHDYFPEKADALHKLAGLVTLILNPPSDNVVPLHGG